MEGVIHSGYNDIRIKRKLYGGLKDRKNLMT